MKFDDEIRRQRCRCGHGRRAGLLEFRIADEGPRAGLRFDENFVAGFDQGFHGVRGERDASFIWYDFLQDSDFHRWESVRV